MPNLRSSPAADISRQFQTGDPPDVRTRPYISVVYLSGADPGDIPPGQNVIISFTPPVGYLYELLQVTVELPIPTEATTGTVKLSIFEFGYEDLGTTARYAYNAKPRLAQGVYMNNPTEKYPTDEAALGTLLRNLIADEGNPIKIGVVNNTDGTISGTKYFKAIVKKVRV